MPQGKNMGRLASDMKRELIAVIGAMKDPALQGGMLTVTRVEVAPDLSSAKVHISVLGAEDATEKAVAALNRAAGHVRSEIAGRMHIRKTPEYRFLADDSARYAGHINQLLAGLHKAEGPDGRP